MQFLVLIVLGIGLYVLGMYILYLVIKAAVRDGITESKRPRSEDIEKEGYTISKTVCESCSKKYDMDYPKCPYCG